MFVIFDTRIPKIKGCDVIDIETLSISVLRPNDKDVNNYLSTIRPSPMNKNHTHEVPKRLWFKRQSLKYLSQFDCDWLLVFNPNFCTLLTIMAVVLYAFGSRRKQKEASTFKSKPRNPSQIKSKSNSLCRERDSK